MNTLILAVACALTLGSTVSRAEGVVQIPGAKVSVGGTPTVDISTCVLNAAPTDVDIKVCQRKLDQVVINLKVRGFTVLNVRACVADTSGVVNCVVGNDTGFPILGGVDFIR